MGRPARPGLKRAERAVKKRRPDRHPSCHFAGRRGLIAANALTPEGRQRADNSLVISAAGKAVREVSDQQLADMKRRDLEFVEKIQRYNDELVEAR